MTRRAAAGFALTGLLLTACSAPGFSTADPTETSPTSSTADAADAETTAPASVEVPDLVGLDGASAVAVLDGAGLGAMGTWRNRDTDPDESFQVYQQLPGAGETVLASDDIVLVMEVPPLPESVVQEADGVLSVWVNQDLDERQAGWIVTDLMNPDRVPFRLDTVVEDRPAGTYSVVFRCEGAASEGESMLGEATFTVDETDAQPEGRRTADEITMVDGATCS